MIILPTAVLLLSTIFGTAVRATESADDLFTRDHNTGVTHSARDILRLEFEDSFSARTNDREIFDRRSDTTDFDDLLYTRNLIEYLIDSRYSSREFDEDSRVDLERRSVVVVNIHQEANPPVHPSDDPWGFSVNAGTHTWTEVKNDIVAEFQGEVPFENIHLTLPNGAEPNDDDIIPSDVGNGYAVGYKIDQDGWDQWRAYEEAEAARKRAKEGRTGGSSGTKRGAPKVGQGKAGLSTKGGKANGAGADKMKGKKAAVSAKGKRGKKAPTSKAKGGKGVRAAQSKVGKR